VTLEDDLLAVVQVDGGTIARLEADLL